jgi:hypothetical protein
LLIFYYYGILSHRNKREVVEACREFYGKLTDILKLRLIEIEKCIKSDASLSVIFLCGSTLEGILLGLATKYPSEFNQAKSAPKYIEEKKVKKLYEWTLNNFIDAACERGFIKEDVKKFSHALKDLSAKSAFSNVDFFSYIKSLHAL